MRVGIVCAQRARNNVVFLHISQSKSGFSVSDPTDEAAGRGWRGGDRKAALAEANVQELHSHLGRHFYDWHRPHHRPRGQLFTKTDEQQCC